MKEVMVIEGEGRVGTFVVAQGLEREHKVVRDLIEKYRTDFEDFSFLKKRKLRSTGGRAADEYLLDEDQFMFLGTLMRNTDRVVSFKKAIIKQFKECRKELESLKNHQAQPTYQITRDAGKMVRKQTTDTMKAFVEYAEEQGSRNAEKYYTNITRMLNSMMFIVEGTHKNIRNMLTIQQLMTVSSAEQIIDKGLSLGMSRKMFYKDIYVEVKNKVHLFADLHGKSEVISQQLLID